MQYTSRIIHAYSAADFGKTIAFFVNEIAEVYQGSATVPVSGDVYALNAWSNRLETVNAAPCEKGTVLSIQLETYKSLNVARLCLA